MENDFSVMLHEVSDIQKEDMDFIINPVELISNNQCQKIIITLKNGTKGCFIGKPLVHFKEESNVESLCFITPQELKDKNKIVSIEKAKFCSTDC